MREVLRAPPNAGRPSFLAVTSDSFRPQTKQGQCRTTNQPEGKVAQRALRAVPDRAAFSFTTLLAQLLLIQQPNQIDSNPIACRVRRKRQRLPPNSPHRKRFGSIFCSTRTNRPRHFRSRLATTWKGGNGR